MGCVSELAFIDAQGTRFYKIARNFNSHKEFLLQLEAFHVGIEVLGQKYLLKSVLALKKWDFVLKYIVIDLIEARHCFS